MKSFILKTLMSLFFIFAAGLEAESIARVMKADGDVLIKPFGQETFSQTASPGDAISNGDAIKVGGVGFAVVIFLDDRSVVKIREKTQFQFMDSDNLRTLNIDSGTIINYISNQKGGKKFRVATPTSVASVKGTIFAAVVGESGVDQFFGSEGIVEVLNLISQQIVNLVPGQKVISNALGNLMSAPASPNEFPQDPDPDVTPDSGDEPSEEGTEDTEDTQETQDTQDTGTEEAPDTGETGQEEDIPESIEDEPTVPESGGSGGGLPFDMGLGIGSVTIDGQLYNQFALRPEFSYGKLGVGLDLVFYLDNDGNFRKDDWDFASDPAQILDKVLYVRWAKKGDPFWVRWGSLDNVTLGYGGLVNGYSNMMEFPTVRRMGINMGFDLGPFNTEIFMANIKDFARGGTLIGVRESYKVSKSFPLSIGVNLVVDLNQFSGLKDRDDDKYPDLFDEFPDQKLYWIDTDDDGLADNDPSEIDIDGDGLPDTDNMDDIHAWWDELATEIGLAGGFDDSIRNKIPDLNPHRDVDPFSIDKEKGRAIGISADIGYPVFSNKLVNLTVYSEINMLQFPSVTAIDRIARSGMGITAPGIRAQILKIVNLSFEYRIKNNYFVPQFFDRAYDLNRVLASNVDNVADVQTKDMVLFRDESSKVNTSGFFGSASVDLLNIASFAAAYTNMVADNVEFNSFYAQVSINADLIPKLSVASAYYQRNNDENPFDFGNPSENTLMGYRLGYSISDGVSLIWNFSQYYRDVGNGLEPFKQTTIETSFEF